ncbi:hypothetical protein RQP46_007301 [Phenoliferia psychrophenolica]
MPFLELPTRHLKVWYTINANGPAVSRLSVYTAPPPESTPLTGKPVLVLLHSALASGDTFLGQVSDPRMLNSLDLVVIDARWHGRTVELEPWKDDPELVASSSRELMQVTKLVMSSPGPLQRNLEVSAYLKGDFLDQFVRNKDGAGDKSGDLPEVLLTACLNTYLGKDRFRLHEREQDFLEHLQCRYVDLQVIRVAPLLLMFMQSSIANRFLLRFLEKTIPPPVPEPRKPSETKSLDAAPPKPSRVKSLFQAVGRRGSVFS